MQISDLYQTKITCSTYNATIDSTNTVITVKLIDFNGAAVTNKSVTLTCDKGYFNKNGSTAISGTTTKSITATTNSSGEITATWTASEWGLCTFSTNNINTQVNVKGWRTYNHDHTAVYTVRYNEDWVQLLVNISSNVNISSSWNGWQNILTDDFIRPEKGIVKVDNSGHTLIRVSNVSENIKFKSVLNSSFQNTVYAEIEWKRK